MAFTRATSYENYQTNGSNYIPQLYAKKMLQDFYAITVYQDICNTDYEGQIKSMGDKVLIRRDPLVTINDYVIGQNADGTGKLTYETPHQDNRTLNIDKAKYAAFQVDDIDEVQMDINLINSFARVSALKMAITVDTDVLIHMAANVDANNTGTAAGAISSSIELGSDAATNTFDLSTSGAVQGIININQALDEQNIPRESRWAVITSEYSAALRISDLKAAYLTGDSTGVIRNGQIGMVDGSMIYVNNNLPVTDQTDIGWTNSHPLILGGTNEATTFAAQITKTDSLKIPDSFGEYWRTLLVYGRAVVQPTAVVLLSYQA